MTGLTGLTSSGNLSSTGTLAVDGALTEAATTDSSSTGSNATVPAPATTILRLTNASLSSIDMISSPTTGRILQLINATGNTVAINNNTGATAANRILTGTQNSIALNDEATASFLYDSTEARWMLVGVSSSGSSNSFQSYELSNLGLSATVAANAMTIAIKTDSGSDPTSLDPVVVGFRSSTAGSGQFTTVNVTSALSTVISSGSTAGQSNGIAAYIYVYLINNAGTAELAWSRALYDEGSLVSTTAEGGAGAADSPRVIYSTTARSNVPLRLVGRLLNTQTTAGTWATNPSEISVVPFAAQSLYATYTTNAGQSIPNNTSTTVVFEDMIYDPQNGMNTATGEYTVQKLAHYTITSYITFSTSAGWEVDEMVTLSVFVNGSERARTFFEFPVTAAFNYAATPHPVIWQELLGVGDVITIRVIQNSDAAITLSASGLENRITIMGNIL